MPRLFVVRTLETVLPDTGDTFELRLLNRESSFLELWTGQLDIESLVEAVDHTTSLFLSPERDSAAVRQLHLPVT